MMSALSFLTILGRARRPDERTLRWFPIVGVAIGIVLAGTYWGSHQLWAPIVAGIIVVAIDLTLTGALHLDGLADTADGVLPHIDRRRRLAVMAEPDVGTFAIAAVFVVLAARWGLFVDPDIEPVALIAIWSTSRTIIATIPALVPYARTEGLVTPFLAGSSKWLGLWIVPAAATLIVLEGWRGVGAVVAAVTVAAALVILARRRLGGFTGDVLGAVVMLSETAALLALAIQP